MLLVAPGLATRNQAKIKKARVKRRRGTVYPTELTVQRRGFCGGTDITGDVQ